METSASVRPASFAAAFAAKSADFLHVWMRQQRAQRTGTAWHLDPWQRQGPGKKALRSKLAADSNSANRNVGRGGTACRQRRHKTCRRGKRKTGQKMHSGSPGSSVGRHLLGEKNHVSDSNLWVILARHSLCHIALFGSAAGHLVRDSTSTPPAWLEDSKHSAAAILSIAETPFVQNVAGTCCKAAAQLLHNHHFKKWWFLLDDEYSFPTIMVQLNMVNLGDKPLIFH